MTKPQTMYVVTRDDAFARAVVDGLEAVERQGVIIDRVPVEYGDSAVPGRSVAVVLDLQTIDWDTEAQGTPVSEPPVTLAVAPAGDAATRIALLRAGIDDVMSPPVDVEELCLRVARLTETPPSRGPLRSAGGEITLDESSRELVVGERRMRLSATECGVLRVLLRDQGLVVSKQRLLREVWGWDEHSDPHVVELYVSYLRKKLAPEAAGLIQTIRGAGYLIRVPLP